MRVMSSLLNHSCRRSDFHLPSSINSWTYTSGQLVGLGVDTQPLVDPGIHLSSQILTVLPSPTRFHSPCCNNSPPLWILFQHQEAVGGGCVSIQFPSFMYFAFKTLLTSKFGLVMTLQICFASKARLRISKSLKPNPPLPFTSDSLLHLTQCIFFSIPPLPTKI